MSVPHRDSERLTSTPPRHLSSPRPGLRRELFFCGPWSNSSRVFLALLRDLCDWAFLHCPWLLQCCSLCEAVSAEQFGVGWRVSVTLHTGLPLTAEGTDEIPLYSCPSHAIYFYCFSEVFFVSNVRV